MRSFIRTVRTQALTSIVERGAMFWEAAELGAASWFLVEVCSVDAKPVERWVTTSTRCAARRLLGRGQRRLVQPYGQSPRRTRGHAACRGYRS